MKAIAKILVSIVLVIMTAVLSFSTAKSLEAYLVFYGENKIYCDDIREDVPFNKSHKAKESVNELLLKLTQYALDYHGDNAFHKTPYLITEMNNARKTYEDMCETEIYFCNSGIKENNIKREYIDKGYIVLSDDGIKNVTYEGKAYYAKTQENKIRNDYNKMLENRLEEIRKTELTYSELTEYIASLENTEYAVFDKNGKALITNTEEKNLQETEEYFKSKSSHILVGQESHDKHAGFSKGLTFLSDDFLFFDTDEDYRLFVSVDEDLGFNGSMNEAEEFYNNIQLNLESRKGKLIKEAVLCLVLSVFTAAALSFIVKPRHPKAVLVLCCFSGVLMLAALFGVISLSDTIINAMTASGSIELPISLSSVFLKAAVVLVFLMTEFFTAMLVALSFKRIHSNE